MPTVECSAPLQRGQCWRCPTTLAVRRKVSRSRISPWGTGTNRLASCKTRALLGGFSSKRKIMSWSQGQRCWFHCMWWCQLCPPRFVVASTLSCVPPHSGHRPSKLSRSLASGCLVSPLAPLGSPSNAATDAFGWWGSLWWWTNASGAANVDKSWATCSRRRCPWRIGRANGAFAKRHFSFFEERKVGHVYCIIYSLRFGIDFMTPCFGDCNIS